MLLRQARSRLGSGLRAIEASSIAVPDGAGMMNRR
jgi:hypothetical protein